jgi:hypothetical protein
MGIEFRFPQSIAEYLPSPVVGGRTACQTSQQFSLARGNFNRGRGAISTSDYALANSELKIGLDKLGYSYENSWTMDDTGQHLGATEFLERQGNVNSKMAAYSRCRILRERLEMCGEVMRKFLHWQWIEHVGCAIPQCPT